MGWFPGGFSRGEGRMGYPGGEGRKTIRLLWVLFQICQGMNLSMVPFIPGVLQRCRLFRWPILIAPWAQMRGEGGGGYGVSANEYSCAQGAQINSGDLTPYFNYGYDVHVCEYKYSWGFCSKCVTVSFAWLLYISNCRRRGLIWY